LKKNVRKIIRKRYTDKEDAYIYHGDARKLIKKIPLNSLQLIITSPPYNIGKEYETQTSLEEYIDFQKEIIESCIPLLNENGSICWQVGNYIDKKNGEIYPLDIILYDIFKKNNLFLKNRIIWYFGHGLNSSKRFSGRYETILWFTKKSEGYVFNLDDVRIPQKYPGKRHFKGPNKGKYSGNKLGKNPSDVWDIPNVKANHVEKTEHPCQFPIALINKLILALTNENDIVFDPFAGSGTTLCSATLLNRKAIGAELDEKYVNIAEDRIIKAFDDTLKYRPMDKPIHKPKKGSKLTYRDDNEDN